MRIRLYFDPEVLARLTEEDEYPTLRQVLDEVSSAGNVDICLFSETTDETMFKRFIEEYDLEGLVLAYQPGLSIKSVAPTDIIADDRDEVLRQTNSIRLHQNLFPLIKWFVSDSPLLDPIYRELNSARFISMASDIMDELSDPNSSVDHICMDYLSIEQIYTELLEIMEASPDLTCISKFGYTVKRQNGKYIYDYEG